MPETMINHLIQLASRNVTNLAAMVAVLLVMGAVLGALKRQALALLGGASRPGNTGSKPRAVLLFLAVALTGAASYAVMRLLPGVTALSHTPEAADPALAEQREAELSERLDIELERLQDRIDALHADGVAREAENIGGPEIVRRRVGFDDFGQSIYQPVRVRRPDYRNFRSYVHKEIRDGPVPSLASVTVIYHRGRCGACLENLRIRKRLDAIREHQARLAKARQAKQQEPPDDTAKGQPL